MDHFRGRAESFTRLLARSAGSLVALAAVDAGKRRVVGWAADAFFLGLVDELATQGVSRTVVADMLGISRRTLTRQIDGARAGEAMRRSSLWKRLFDLVDETPRSRAELLATMRLSPEVLSSLVTDMMAHGWIEERDHRLHALELHDELSDDELASLLDAMWRVPSVADPAQIAAELGVTVERVERHWRDRGDREFMWFADDQNKWLALEHVVERALWFVRARLIRPSDAQTGGVYTLRADVQSADTMDRLRAAVRDAIAGVREASEAVGDPSVVWDRAESRIWTVTMLELFEREPEDTKARLEHP